MAWETKRRVYYFSGGISITILIMTLFFYLRYSDQEDPGIIKVNGRIEGDEISVSSKIAGRVVFMPWREGSRIEKDHLVARISSEQIKAQLDRAQAGWNAAQERVQEQISRVRALEKEVELASIRLRLAREQSEARISQAIATLEAANATVKEKEADLIKTKNDNQRYTALFKQGVISAHLLDGAKTAYDAASSRKEAAEKLLREAEADLHLARSTILEIELKQKELESTRALLEQAKASLASARSEARAAEAARDEANATWADAEIHAPLTGTVITKVADPGEYVVPGSPIIILIDLSKLYLKAYLKEIDIGKIRLGNPARIYVDAFPNRFFEAAISEIAQHAEFTPKNVYIKEERVRLVFGVKLDVRDSEGYLKPGMPCDAEILWKPGATW